MIIITLPNGTDWFKANWVFRQLIEETALGFPENSLLISTLERAQALGHLALDQMEPLLRLQTTSAIKQIAEETLQGTVAGLKRTRTDDHAGQQLYLEAVAELLQLIQNAEK